MKKCFLNCNFTLTQNGEMGQRKTEKNNNIHVKNDRNLSLNSISAPSSSSQQRVDSRRHEQRRKTHFSCVHTKHSINFFEWVLGSACSFEEFSMLAQVNFNSLSTLTLNLQPASSVEMKTRNDLLLRYWAFSRIIKYFFSGPVGEITLLIHSILPPPLLLTDRYVRFGLIVLCH